MGIMAQVESNIDFYLAHETDISDLCFQSTAKLTFFEFALNVDVKLK